MHDSEIHAGYEFEEGMLTRKRSWVDLFPWIRLTRVLRILASPSYVGIVFLAWTFTSLLFATWFGAVRGPLSIEHFQSDARLMLKSFYDSNILHASVFVVLVVVVWTPIAQLIARAGAELSAGKPMPSNRETLRLCTGRWWLSCLVPIVPLGCVLMFGIALFLIRIPSILIDNDLVSAVTGWVVGLLSIPVGVLGFGALAAIPLALVAMVCEQDPDPIDSLSRGYEYLVRRPLFLIWYLIVSFVLIYLSGFLLEGICSASSIAVTLIGSVFTTDGVQIDAALAVIALLLTSWKMTLAIGLLGGFYLLLRHDAGGQEVEDLWTPVKPSPGPLPSLPDEAYES